MNKDIITIDDYINGFPEKTKEILSNIRKIINQTAPEAIESISYGMPAYKLKDKPLIYFAGFKNHIGLYATPAAHSHFEKELSQYKKGKGSVQFPLNKPIPYDLIKIIVEFKIINIMADKSKQIDASIRLVNDKLNFIGTVEDNTPISIDYIPPLGDNLGYTSLELLLLSLSSCIGSSILTFLRKMNKSVKGCEIHSKGLRKEEHPTGFKKIFIEIIIESSNISSADMDKVLKLTEDTYCPVWSMIKGNVDMEVSYEIRIEKEG